MSGSPAPLIPPSKGIPVPTADPSVWDRITTWASEHKAVVYTIAGVTVVVAGAGVFYYVNNSSVCFMLLFAQLFDPNLQWRRCAVLHVTQHHIQGHTAES